MMIRSGCSKSWSTVGRLVALRFAICRYPSEAPTSCGAGSSVCSGGGAATTTTRTFPTVSWSRCLSSSSSSNGSAPVERLPIPPNLKFDPRSSFAPQPLTKKKRKPLPFPSFDTDREDNQQRQEDFETEDGFYEDEEEDDEDFALYMPEKDIKYAIPLPDRLKVEIHTLFAPKHSSLCGTIVLDESVFGKDPIRIDLIKRTVDWFRAHKRGRRKAHSKTISEVSGSGRKVRPQKGSGRARAGHSRPPHWRHGARVHGKKNTRDYGKMKLNKKVRQAALRHVLSQKLKEGNLIVLNQMHELPTHKTGELNRLLKPWGFGIEEGATALLLDHYYPDKQWAEDDETKPKANTYYGVPVNLHVASGNLFRLQIGNSHRANVFDILRFEKLVMTLSALQIIESRLKE